MEFDNEGIEIPNMINASIFLRGKVITNVSVLEFNMDTFLSYHFAKSEKFARELIEILFSTNKITFDSKKALAFEVASEHYKSILSAFPNYNRDMSEIAKKRNIFAHQHLSIDLASNAKFALDETLTFVKFHSGSGEEFDSQKVEDLFNLIKKYIDFFKILLVEQGTLSP